MKFTCNVILNIGPEQDPSFTMKVKLWRFLGALGILADGLVGVLSLGIVWTNLGAMAMDKMKEARVAFFRKTMEGIVSGNQESIH